MVDAKGVPEDPGATHQAQQRKKTEDLAEKRRELAAFREAGVLTEAEFEEQLVRFRWGIP